MFRRIGLVGLIYIIVGIVVAWEKHYITVHLLKLVLSALLAIFLWGLPLRGVSLNIHKFSDNENRRGAAGEPRPYGVWRKRRPTRRAAARALPRAVS
jgi:hypothetical protein